MQRLEYISNFVVGMFNRGQRIADKFTKLSKIGLSMECFTADFSLFTCTNVKICFLGGRVGTLRQI